MSEMKAPIYLYEDEGTYEIDSPLPLVCTNAFFNQCADFSIDSEVLINQLVEQKVFLINYAPKSKEFFNILTEKVILVCALEEEGNFTITSVQEKTVGKQNHFIKHALKIRTNHGAVLWHGQRSSWGTVRPETARRKFQPFVSGLVERINDLKTPGKEETNDLEEEYTVSNKLDELLTMAEYYVTAEDEIQKVAAQSGPQISYYQFSAVDDYARVEKLAYKFLVNDFDQNLYKKGARVVIHLDGDEEVSGVIMDIDTDQEPYSIVILFDEKFQVNKMLPQGIISLEYNAVQRMVREEVIEGIRNGTTPSTYIDPVIGRGEFRGFSDKKLDHIIDRLKNSTKPPNESQLEAIKKGVETEDALLVLGPPGTGKTTVILEWVKYFVLEEELRVLVSSQNNKAVDNVLEKLVDEDKIDTIRIGSEEKIQSNITPLMYENRAYELQKNIINANEVYMKKVQEKREELTKFFDKLSELEPIAKEVQTLHDDLVKRYDSLYKDYIEPLKDYKDQDQKQKNKIQDLRGEIDKLKEKINKHLNSPAWKKVFTWIMYMINKRSLNSASKKYRELHDENEMIIKEYQNLIDSMEEFRKDKIEPVKNRWYQESDKWDDAVLEVEDFEYRDLGDNILELSPRSIDKEKALDELTKLKKSCDKQYRKVRIVEKALNRWRGFLDNKKNYALSKVLLESVDLIGATCIGINSQQRFQNLDFDVAIIDEAGQIQIHNAIVPMSRAEKVIMLGDHLQIPPIADEAVIERCKDAGIDTDFLTKSLFEYLYEDFSADNKILLDTQYRMPDVIAELLSEWFYEGKYRSFKNKIDVKTPFPNLFNNPFVLIDTSTAKNRYETRVLEQGYYNDYEANLVVEVLKQILSEAGEADDEDESYRKPLNDVGVITPYKKQVQHIRDMVIEAIPGISKKEVVDLVASLDSFQGQERSVIIYSCTRSSKKPPHVPRIGFLKELRRLNVALSRCQEQLVFIGDLEFLSTCEYFEKDDFEQPLVDEYGRPLPGTSEKEFSQFINLMLSYAEQGKAQRINSKDL
ncbi:AAA domain-containing protein [Natranaerofaba carboxydovora]|uniref:AAA domain-containing protein n=1 Tax=Natranaerofaba carboxydovora TaxID=2742683 RepID=UPI001F12CABC|nr:AAA domain-containing protein [Natranaerofaba carboxydovora]UMZ74705.1 AAA domain protein [Natranaerofaba carboxydovora]